MALSFSVGSRYERELQKAQVELADCGDLMNTEFSVLPSGSCCGLPRLKCS